MKEIKLVDQTLRDAHQCLWATRMSTASMLPVAEPLDLAGFSSIDIAGHVQFDVCVRFLKENPWERLRLLRQRLQRTPMRAFMRAKGFSFNDILADDLIDLWIERLVANGIRMIVAFDGLNDINNLSRMLQVTHALGACPVGCVTFSLSPVHTDDMYTAFAADLVKAGAEVVMLKDSGGLLTVDRIRTLIPRLRKAIGTTPLEIHGHCTTSLAALVYEEAVKHGADTLHTSIAPLANGTAQPGTQAIARNLRHIGYAVNVDDGIVAQISEHFRKVALKEGKPLGVPLEYDATHYSHQLPGGMSGNFEASLAEAGMSGKLGDVLEECTRVREDLGWPMAITPFSQLIGTQALINVIQGERYKTVPDPVKKYALGHYGRLLAPVKPDILDRIVENGSAKISEASRVPKPMVPALRKKYQGLSDDEILLRQMYAGKQVDVMLAAPPVDLNYTFDSPILALIKGLARQSRHKSISIRTSSLELQLGLN